MCIISLEHPLTFETIGIAAYVSLHVLLYHVHNYASRLEKELVVSEAIGIRLVPMQCLCALGVT
jgi:hypothetical protein